MLKEILDKKIKVRTMRKISIGMIGVSILGFWYLKELIMNY